MLGFSQAKCIPWDADCWKTEKENIICTMEYAPVCASVQVQCIQAPCPPLKETFGNRCQMEANGLAKFLYEGECEFENENKEIDLNNCETYFDGCNNCSVVNWELLACTLMYCENPSEPKCTKTKEWNVSMANPASVYCENNWWTLEIQNQKDGQIWICNFDDWSNCEEWAFYRWECKWAPQIDKNISWNLNNNIAEYNTEQSKVNFWTKVKNVYRYISNTISSFIETFYTKDYETRKFTLDANGEYMSFSLDIPKDWKNNFSERAIVSDSQIFGWLGSMSTIIFEYNKVKWNENMIFSITMVDQDSREELTKEWEFNMNKIGENNWYVFYYSQALDMPYDWEDAKIYGNMVWDIDDIIDSFDIISN